MRNVNIFKSFQANSLYFIRHGERLDKVNLSWTKGALRPHDTPLSPLGKKQATNLGKWLYGRLNIHEPLVIYSSPFIRCVQTAHFIAEQLDSLQSESYYSNGEQSSFSTNICIEPGIAEDPFYMNGLHCDKPWFLNPEDLMSISDRINLDYKPIRHVNYKKEYDYEKTQISEPKYKEISHCGTQERLTNIAFELSCQPKINKGVGIIVSHAKPSVDMIRSLNYAPEGIELPHYDDIKEGRYTGPPIEYTSCTHMVNMSEENKWALASGTKLFSNDHDPILKLKRRDKRKRITRIVMDNELIKNGVYNSKIYKFFTLEPYILHDKKPGETFVIHNVKASMYRKDVEMKITLPMDYIPGDKIVVKTI